MIDLSPYADALASVSVKERSIDVFDVTTRYWEYGSSTAVGTIVVVHGFRGDHHGLEAVIANLDGRHVIAPDLPGFGASEPFADRPHDLAAYAAWLRAFVDRLGLVGPVTVLGHSFGSIVVAAALAGAPDVESDGADAAAEAPPALDPVNVVLVNPIGAPALKGPRAVGTLVAVGYYRLGAALPERLGQGLLRNRLIVRAMSEAMAKSRDVQLRTWIHRQHDSYFSAFANRRVVLEAFEASISHDVSEFAPRVRQRTLLIAAERDDITPVAAQRRLVELFPDARLEVIPAVGHLIHYETPVIAADLIARFVGDEATA